MWECGGGKKKERMGEWGNRRRKTREDEEGNERDRAGYGVAAEFLKNCRKVFSSCLLAFFQSVFFII